MEKPITFVIEHFRFDPYQPKQMWRFLTYMFCHETVRHFASNAFTQLLFGIPLEYLYSGWRVMLVYLAGVFGGSLGLLTFHRGYNLIGSSAGGFALIFAYIMTLILNWRELKHRFFYTVLFLYIIGLYLAFSILSPNNDSSHVSHISGALCGFLLAPMVLSKIRVNDFKTIFKWVFFLTWVLLIITAVAINIYRLHIFQGIDNPVGINLNNSSNASRD